MVIKVLNLAKCIKEIQGAAGIDIMPVIKESARKVQRSAKDRAPVGTPESTGIKGYVGGTLKGSIKVKHFPDQQTSVVYTTLEYAPHVEFGTVKMAPRPFLQPAFDENKADIQKKVGKFINDEIAKKKNG